LASVQISDPRRCYVTVTDREGREETFSAVDPRAWFDFLGESLPKAEKPASASDEVSSPEE